MDVVDPTDPLRVGLDVRQVQVDDTGSCPERTTTQESGADGAALISWCGTYGGT